MDLGDMFIVERSSFRATEIRSDKHFKKVLEMFRDNQLQKYQMTININIANTKQHVPHAECDNCTF